MKRPAAIPTPPSAVAPAAAEGKEIEAKERKNARKWGKKVWDAGWVAVPAVLVENQAALGLSAIDLNIILYLVNHWWKKDDLPFPSQKTIAKATGMSPRTVSRHLLDLHESGFVRMHHRRRADGGKTSNEYSFDGLVAALKPFAIQKIKERSKREAERHKDATARAGRRLSRKAREKIALELEPAPE